MDQGTQERLTHCGQMAVQALSLDSDHDSPNDVKAAIERLQFLAGVEIAGLRGPIRCPAGACDGCGGFHHWLPECAGDDTPPPPGTRLAYWFKCKHCTAWCEEVEED